jgi:hypothetical protein
LLDLHLKTVWQFTTNKYKQSDMFTHS